MTGRGGAGIIITRQDLAVSRIQFIFPYRDITALVPAGRLFSYGECKRLYSVTIFAPLDEVQKQQQNLRIAHKQHPLSDGVLTAACTGYVLPNPDYIRCGGFCREVLGFFVVYCTESPRKSYLPNNVDKRSKISV